MLRYEYKYFVPYEKLERLRMMIKPFMQVDKHAGDAGGEYTVRSIYFDTPGMDCYYQKIEGVKRRNKVRLRGYNAEDDRNTVFFEIKKKVDEPLYKNRASMTFEAAKRILQGESPEHFLSGENANPKALENARRFLYHLHARRMKPVVTVVYEREPYQAVLKDRDNDLRITFDKNLRSVANPPIGELFEEKNAVLVNRRLFIMEIKFNRYLPAWVKSIVTTFGLTKVPASKYLMCVDANRAILTDAKPLISNGAKVAQPPVQPLIHHRTTATY